MTDLIQRPNGPPDLTRLTESERRVLACLALGYTNAQATQLLSMRLSTVKAHVRGIFAKLGVKSRTQVALLAQQAGVSLELERRELPDSAPIPGTADYVLTLDQADAEWAKAQPGGRSALVRDLLAWERWLSEAADGDADLAAAKRIACKGLRESLSPDEVRQLGATVLRLAAEKCDG